MVVHLVRLWGLFENCCRTFWLQSMYCIYIVQDDLHFKKQVLSIYSCCLCHVFKQKTLLHTKWEILWPWQYVNRRYMWKFNLPTAHSPSRYIAILVLVCHLHYHTWCVWCVSIHECNFDARHRQGRAAVVVRLILFNIAAIVVDPHQAHDTRVNGSSPSHSLPAIAPILGTFVMEKNRYCI